MADELSCLLPLVSAINELETVNELQQCVVSVGRIDRDVTRGVETTHLRLTSSFFLFAHAAILLRRAFISVPNSRILQRILILVEDRLIPDIKDFHWDIFLDFFFRRLFAFDCGFLFAQNSIFETNVNAVFAHDDFFRDDRHFIVSICISLTVTRALDAADFIALEAVNCVDLDAIGFDTSISFGRFNIILFVGTPNISIDIPLDVASTHTSIEGIDAASTTDTPIKGVSTMALSSVDISVEDASTDVEEGQSITIFSSSILPSLFSLILRVLPLSRFTSI